MNNKFNIEKFLDLTNYATDVRKDRRKSKEVNTQEFFTPYSIVKRMCDKVSDEDWADPKKTFLEPSFGHGQFILFILYKRIVEYNIDWEQALSTVWGIELMSDNVAECKQRVHKMLEAIAPDYNKASATRIMNKNFICHDFFTWDFEEWRPMTEEEIKLSKKKK